LQCLLQRIRHRHHPCCPRNQGSFELAIGHQLGERLVLLYCPSALVSLELAIFIGCPGLGRSHQVELVSLELAMRCFVEGRLKAGDHVDRGTLPRLSLQSILWTRVTNYLQRCPVGPGSLEFAILGNNKADRSTGYHSRRNLDSVEFAISISYHDAIGPEAVVRVTKNRLSLQFQGSITNGWYNSRLTE
jgi:hypothetical protein